jgi:hypothetical protein
MRIKPQKNTEQHRKEEHKIPFVCVFLCFSVTLFAAQERPRFKSGSTLVSVDVIVRDRSTGQIVKDLKTSDFEIREDGRPQEISTFTFQEIADKPAKVITVDLLAAAEAKVPENARRTAPAQPAAAAVPESPEPLTSQALAGRRLIVLLFDVSSMQPEDVSGRSTPRAST